MKGSTFFGYRCPNCGSTVQVGVAPGTDTLACPSCGSEMKPDPKGQASAANVFCPRCKLAVGFVTSDTCPQCGGPWSGLP